MHRMTFGKHRGLLITDVPTPYLQWVVRECFSIEPWLKAAVREELKRRGVEVEENPRSGRYPPPADLRLAIKTWFAGLARDYHPDRTGDNGKVMAALNEAHERLRKLVGIS